MNFKALNITHTNKYYNSVCRPQILFTRVVEIEIIIINEQHNRIIVSPVYSLPLHQATSRLCNAGTGTFSPPNAAEI